MTSSNQPHDLLWAMTKEENLIMTSGLLVGVLLVGGIIMNRIDRWRKRQMEDTDDSTGHLGSFREMFDRGELTKEEYDRVLRRMADRVAQKAIPKPSEKSKTTLTVEPPETPAPNIELKPPTEPMG